MKTCLSFLLDLLFPPNAETLELRSLSTENVFDRLPRAPLPPHTFINSIFAYKNNIVSNLIWNIKYKKDKHAIRLGGYALFKRLNEMQSRKVILIPIPISKKRRKERGYNQCELLIDVLIKLDKEDRFEKRFDVLLKSKHTSDQKLKKRKERLNQEESIFSVNRATLNFPIIIIDDVATTGSTLKEAMDTLIEAGYKDVTCLTLAH